MNSVVEAFMDKSRSAPAAKPTVRLCDESDRNAWNGFVASHPHATVYHRWEWRDIIHQVHGHRPWSLVAEADGQICGVLPLAHNKTMLFGNSLVSLPFCPYGGPLFDSADAETVLLERASQICADIGASHLELRHLHAPSRPARVQDLYVTFRKPITADDEANMNAIPRKQRAMVRKGIKNGLSAELGTVDQFYPLYLDNIHRHGTPGSPKKFFQAMADAFGQDAEVMVIKSAEGKIITAVFTLYFRDEVLPFYAGDLVDARDLAANDFKYWAVMQHAAKRGARVFDFGRSKKGTGPFSFKKNWGFEPTQLHYEYLGLGERPIPENNPLNPKYQLMIATWRRLPRPVVGWLGPLVVKGLG